MGDMPTSRPWADLPIEILSLFLHHLDFDDRPRFGEVCQSWRSAAADPLSNRAPELPFLLFCHNPVTLAWPFLSFSEDRIHNLNLQVPSGTWWFGSSHGWLFAAHHVVHEHLLNPLTKQRIPLPRLSSIPPQFFPVKSSDFFVKAVLSAAPAAEQDWVALAIRSYAKERYHGLVFCQPGDRTWSSLPETLRYGSFCDVITDDGGLFCCLTTRGEIVVLEFTTGPSVKKFYEPKLMDGSDMDRSPRKYLVKSCEGRFLMAIQNQEFHPEFGRFTTSSFDVYKLDAGGNYWAPMDWLEGETQFLGVGSSRSLKVANVSWFRPNCIYFTDVAYTKYIARRKDYYFLDRGMFSVEDGGVWTLQSNDRQAYRCAPIWFSLKD